MFWATLVPSWPHGHAAWSTLVALPGTAISPYLFVWQAAQEVEKEKAQGLKTVAQRRDASEQSLSRRRMDVAAGAFFASLIRYFIILTSASTLHAAGHTRVATTRDAVASLEPLAGRFASLLFALGLVGVGFLAIPTLAGSAAYVFVEIFKLRHGLDEKLHRARAFYSVMVLSIVLGIILT